jgi:hypothetical protein
VTGTLIIGDSGPKIKQEDGRKGESPPLVGSWNVNAA